MVKGPCCAGRPGVAASGFAVSREKEGSA